MSPLWWMQSTAPHWTVILENVSSDIVTEVGEADGAGEQEMMSPGFHHVGLPLPVSPVIPVTGSLTALPAAFVAFTVMV